MDFGLFSKRFARVSSGFLALLMATPCLADMPPLGYVGPWPPPKEAVQKAPSVSVNTPPAASNASAVALSPNPPNPNHGGETLISAKQMHSDSETGIVMATGNVEVVRNEHILHADTVTYNQKTNVMTADGHVALLTPSGDVEFSDHQEVTGDMKQGFAENVGILFPDNSRMAAKVAQRYDDRYTVADNALYTACNVCREHPENPPLWQMKAETITHDNVEHELYYHNATIDFAGVPVAYTPYMSGPDPTVKRLQGFLPPTPGTSPNIGTYVKVPYYIDIAPDKDATIAPTFSTTDKVQLEAQYRERFASGALSLNGSITHADLIDTNSGIDRGDRWRGNLMGKYLTDIDNVWRAGGDVQYASDRSYLRRYGISSIDQTTSRAFTEGFQGRDYVNLSSYYFQDLRAGTAVSEPVVVPSATFSALGDPGQAWGGRWSLDGNTLVTARDNSNKSLAQQGPDTRRLSLNGGWQRQLISSTGLETTVSGLVRTDSYWADNVISADSEHVYDRALFTRQFEQANAVMRYPMGRGGDGYQQLLEPIVAVTAAPNVRLISKQPNEDSLDVEFDETNLFSPNRFTGSDLIEGGSRVTYGMRNALWADNGAQIDLFGGESYDFTVNRDFLNLSGLDKHASDYVGRLDFSPAPWLTANYGFRLSQSDLSPQRQDASVSFGAPIFRPAVRYIQAYEFDAATNAIDQVRQITFSFTSNFAKYWALSGFHTQSFDPQPGPRNQGISVNYIDECFGFGASVSHDDTNRVDISSGTSIAFHIFLKNLGGVHTDSVGGLVFPTEFRQTAP